MQGYFSARKSRAWAEQAAADEARRKAAFDAASKGGGGGLFWWIATGIILALPMCSGPTP